MRFHSAVEELSIQIPRITGILGQFSKDTIEIGIIYDADRDHMVNEECRDAFVEAHGFRNGMPFIEYSPGVEKDKDTTQHGQGFAIYKTQTDDKLKEPIHYALLTIPSEIKEYNEAYVLVDKAKLQALVSYWERIEIKEEVVEAVKPILNEDFLQQIIDSSFGFLMRRKEISKYNVKLKRGVLLDGDPGNGKTMTMRYIRQLCQEKNIHTRNITASQLMSAFQDDVLEEFMSCAPVMFFDDIDVSFFNRRRNEGGDGRMCCALLSAMDGMNETDHCIRIFSTNERIEDMDPAFKRPGRIDRVFSFGLPSEDERLQLIKTWHHKILEDIAPEIIAKRTEGMSFAETDSIKDLLVTNKIFGDKKWNLDCAFEMYADTQAAKVETQQMKDELKSKDSEDESDKTDKNVPVSVPVSPDSLEHILGATTARGRAKDRKL